MSAGEIKPWLLAAAVVAGVLVVLGGVGLWQLRPDPPEWTTRSRAAREQFLAGLDDRSRNYLYDATVHFERALELDRDFASAMLYLSSIYPPGHAERERWLERLRAADLDRLTARERFLVRYALAIEDGEEERARERLREFLAGHPEDPHAIRIECDLLWRDQDWDGAERCYARLLELHPNWVEAADRLGYIAMARGRFAEAEEHFRTYRYVANDQAAPYVSLAELYILRGRYDEAEEQLAAAIAAKPDYCEAFKNRIRLLSLTARFAEAAAAIDEFAAVETCGFYREVGFFCSMRAWLAYQQKDAERAWEVISGDCLERLGGFDATAFRIAAATGRWAEADRIQESLKAQLERTLAERQPVYAEYYAAILSHVEGVRHLIRGELTEALERFRLADSELGYWVGKLAGFKLYNQLHVLRVLEALGREDEADAVRRDIDTVNPRVIYEFRIPGLDDLRPPVEHSPDPAPWERGSEISD